MVLSITLIGGILRVFLLVIKDEMDETFSLWLPTTVLSICCIGLSKLTRTLRLLSPAALLDGIQWRYSILCRLLSALFGAEPSDHLPDRQTHICAVMGLRQRDHGSFAFTSAGPGCAHVHPAGVQCKRCDVCTGQTADGRAFCQAIGSQFREYCVPATPGQLADTKGISATKL